MAINNEEKGMIQEMISNHFESVITNFLPVGTVITSTLSYEKFRKSVKDPDVFDPKKSRWSPADGRNIEHSEYYKVVESLHVPDLRGVFLRGLNVFDVNEKEPVSNTQKDPEANRIKVGSFQNDQIRFHSHESNLRIVKNNWEGGPNVRYQAFEIPGQANNLNTAPFGGDETRPKNVAVYYYIKIN